MAVEDRKKKGEEGPGKKGEEGHLKKSDVEEMREEDALKILEEDALKTLEEEKRRAAEDKRRKEKVLEARRVLGKSGKSVPVPCEEESEWSESGQWSSSEEQWGSGQWSSSEDQWGWPWGPYGPYRAAPPPPF